MVKVIYEDESSSIYFEKKDLVSFNRDERVVNGGLNFGNYKKGQYGSVINVACKNGEIKAITDIDVFMRGYSLPKDSCIYGHEVSSFELEPYEKEPSFKLVLNANEINDYCYKDGFIVLKKGMK